jgi:hypothetical protein
METSFDHIQYDRDQNNSLNSNPTEADFPVAQEASWAFRGDCARSIPWYRIENTSYSAPGRQVGITMVVGQRAQFQEE